MKTAVFTIVFLHLLSVFGDQYPDYPDGYYPFQEDRGRIPPKVRKPPYMQTNVKCAGAVDSPEPQSLNNLCGDLNKGYLPLNPMGQNVNGFSYPFELIKTKCLDFFSKLLPVLKQDQTLPKVARYRPNGATASNIQLFHRRSKRSEEEELPEDLSRIVTDRQARAFCDENFGVFCMLYNAFTGAATHNANEKQDYSRDPDIPGTTNDVGELETPLTPCPSEVEYVTPVFAKNYQGVWRYVVQVPYEGYFTQTVEVTKCLNSKCHFLDGSCLASPRWVSMLVAEIFYPDATFPTRPGPKRRPVRDSDAPPVTEFQKYQQYLQERASNRVGQEAPTAIPSYCDGVDDIGCFQVRLYYDWFLIPGSCKCWKQDFFSQFALKK